MIRRSIFRYIFPISNLPHSPAAWESINWSKFWIYCCLLSRPAGIDRHLARPALSADVKSKLDVVSEERGIRRRRKRRPQQHAAQSRQDTGDSLRKTFIIQIFSFDHGQAKFGHLLVVVQAYFEPPWYVNQLYNSQEMVKHILFLMLDSCTCLIHFRKGFIQICLCLPSHSYTTTWSIGCSANVFIANGSL